MLSDHTDTIRLAEGMRRLLSLCRHSAISRTSEGIVLDEPGTTPDHLADQAVLVDWLRANVTNYVHTPAPVIPRSSPTTATPAAARPPNPSPSHCPARPGPTDRLGTPTLEFLRLDGHFWFCPND
jgi:hypothetical protein